MSGASATPTATATARATLGSVYHFFPGGKEAVAVAAITHGDQEFSALLRAALRGWEHLVHDKLLGPGIPAGDAQGLATTIISALEGAEVTAQVVRSEEPLCATGRQLARLVGSYGTSPVS
ncbi:hypothetical protein Q3V23_34460 [Streptomyces sp. VNUA116]|uniref:LmrA/YxaF family transcription factor n=1 Tax=Streptomyces sp. VNUA116 TaxID=3062449 RepID=UPI0026773F66|nr:hypothetical protein [Streptomyces sp. VNUA116]WKU49573.1 hypothetical protein Q3V23_34460 [Streptomyces sp. VNUA116]